MLNLIARLALTASAIAPVCLVYAWMAVLAEEYGFALLLTVICAILVAICILILTLAKKMVAPLSFSASKIEAADREHIGFLLLYLLPLFTSKFEDLNWDIWVPAIVVFAVITATGYTYHFNPLIGFLGYHFYKVEAVGGVTYVLITRRQLHKAAVPLQVGQLTEYILLDLGEKPNDSSGGSVSLG